MEQRLIYPDTEGIPLKWLTLSWGRIPCKCPKCRCLIEPGDYTLRMTCLKRHRHHVFYLCLSCARGRSSASSRLLHLSKEEIMALAPRGAAQSPFTADVREWISQIRNLGLVAVPTWGQGKALPSTRGTTMKALADQPPSLEDLLDGRFVSSIVRALPEKDRGRYWNLGRLADFSGGLAIVSGNAAPAGGYIVSFDIDVASWVPADKLPAELLSFPPTAETLLVERGTRPGNWHVFLAAKDRFPGKLSITARIGDKDCVLAEVNGYGATHLRSWPTTPADKPAGYERFFVAAGPLPPRLEARGAADGLADFLSRILGVDARVQEQERRAPGSRGAAPLSLVAAIEADLEKRESRLSNPGPGGFRAGYCPFHDDRRKSFSINPERNFWQCFSGCGQGSLADLAKRLGLEWKPPERQPATRLPRTQEPRTQDAPGQKGADREGSYEGLRRQRSERRNAALYGIVLPRATALSERGESREDAEFYTIEKVRVWSMEYGIKLGILVSDPTLALSRDQTLEAILHLEGIGSKLYERFELCMRPIGGICPVDGLREWSKTTSLCRQFFHAWSPTQTTSKVRQIELPDLIGGTSYRTVWFGTAFDLAGTEDFDGPLDMAKLALEPRMKAWRRAVTKRSHRKVWKGKILARAESFYLTRQPGERSVYVQKLVLQESVAGELTDEIYDLARELQAEIVGDRGTESGEAIVLQMVADTMTSLIGIAAGDWEALGAFISATRGQHLFMGMSALYEVLLHIKKDEAPVCDLCGLKLKFVPLDEESKEAVAVGQARAGPWPRW